MTDPVGGGESPDSRRFAEIRRITEQAFDLPAAERAAFVAAACAEDAELGREVQAILDHDVGLDISEVVRAGVSTAAESIGDLAGTRIGGFRLLRRIGSGGMGTVYEAEQDEPRRSVALKTLGAGLLDPESISRFRFESEILARLDHRNIATIFEAGTHQVASGDGNLAIPYFAMEYVKGAQPITDFARERGLDLRARLDLVDAVCAAVHHGHLNGVIHRDLKPANILVDEHGEPKVIDFGVARASDLEGSMRTRTGELVGTLQYMSPEQVEGRTAEIDPRSDVFALGAVLFELLCGQPPHDLRDRSLSEVIRHVGTQSARRLRSIDASLPIELEWIAGKALRTERELRYASAEDLRQDLRRFLAHAPVVAGPPSAWYHARKWMRRHRVAVSFAAVLLATLIGGLVTVSLSLSRERLARVRAEASREFMSAMLGAVAPERHGVDVRVVDMLDDAAARLIDDPPADALVAADVHYSLGDAYRNLGRYAESEHHLRRAFEIRGELLDAGDPELVTTTGEFAKILPMVRRLDEADTLLRRAIDGYTALYGETSFKVLDAYGTLTHVLSMQGRGEEALAVAERMVELHPPDWMRPEYAMLRAQETLAHHLEVRGDAAGVRRAFEAMIVLRARLSDVDHPALPDRTSHPPLDLRRSFAFEADPDQAADVLLAVLAALDAETASVRKNRFLTDTVKEANNFGHYFLDWGSPAKSRDLFAGILEPAERLQGKDGDLAGNARIGLGKALLLMNEPAAAVVQLRETYQARLRLNGRENWQTFTARWAMIEALEQAQQFEELVAELALAIEDVGLGYPGSDLPEGDLRAMRAVNLRQLDRDDEAEGELLRAYEVNQGAGRKDHNAIWPIIELTRLYSEQDRREDFDTWNARLPEEVRRKKKDDE